MTANADQDFAYSGVENLEAMEHAKNYNRFLLKLIRRNLRGSRVVDFGAGSGTFASALHAAGIDVCCIEPDSALRERLINHGLVTHSEVSRLAPGSVDSIYSLNVLEHIEDDSSMLAELRSRLAPNGRLVLYVPAFNILYSSMDRLVGHYRRYRRNELKKMAASAGFFVEKAVYVDSLGFFSALLFRFIGGESGAISARSIRIYDRLVFPLSRIVDHAVAGSFGKNLLLVCSRAADADPAESNPS